MGCAASTLAVRPLSASESGKEKEHGKERDIQRQSPQLIRQSQSGSNNVVIASGSSRTNNVSSEHDADDKDVADNEPGELVHASSSPALRAAQKNGMRKLTSRNPSNQSNVSDGQMNPQSATRFSAHSSVEGGSEAIESAEHAMKCGDVVTDINGARSEFKHNINGEHSTQGLPNSPSGNNSVLPNTRDSHNRSFENIGNHPACDSFDSSIPLESGDHFIVPQSVGDESIAAFKVQNMIRAQLARKTNRSTLDSPKPKSMSRGSNSPLIQSKDPSPNTSSSRLIPSSPHTGNHRKNIDAAGVGVGNISSSDIFANKVED